MDTLITKDTFTKPFIGASSRYSKFAVLDTDMDTVINALNKIPGVSPEGVLGGKTEDGAVIFTIFDENPSIIKDITALTKTRGYADTAWDYFDFAAYDNGEKLDDFFAAWDEDNPCDQDDESECVDAFFTVTDSKTGYVFKSGAGCVDGEDLEICKNIVENHLI